MRIVVAGEQISFFERYGFVELESFFSEQEMSHLLFGIEHELEQRRKEIPSESLDDPSSTFGYDLALTSEVVRKELCSLRLAKATFELIRKKPLRYAFDRLLRIPAFSLSSPMEEVSSVAPLIISVVIALESQSEIEGKPSVPFEVTSFPKLQGSVLFIAQKTVVKTKDMLPGRYLVVGYTAGQPIYRLQPQDPHTHFLKSYGYVFGDQLKQTTHPVLFR